MARGGGRAFSRRVRAVGPHGLRAVVTEPAGGAEGAATLVFLNSGAEPHYGPGRAWVVFARELAARGRRTVRVDFRGTGADSLGDDAGLDAEPYADHRVDDVRSIVRALAEDGQRAVPFGLCSSAYVALQAATLEPLAGCVALNPQPLPWRPGQPIDLTPAENHLFRRPIQRQEERWQRLRLWSALDVLGARTHAGRSLDLLRRRRAPSRSSSRVGTTASTSCACGSGGSSRLPARVAEALIEIDDIDHALHRAWSRGTVVDVLDDALARAELVTP